jgi:NADH-quinone oxidoreductase subunit E
LYAFFFYFCTADNELTDMTTDHLEQIFSKYALNKRDGLIPILQDIQQEEGHLTEELLAEVGRFLNLPSNRIYGVATFYDQFRFHPLGKFHIRICRGAACHLFGTSTFQQEIEKQLKVKAGHASKDKRFSLEISNCMGACQSAPVICVNGAYHTNVSAERLTVILNSLKEKPE